MDIVVTWPRLFQTRRFCSYKG